MALKSKLVGLNPYQEENSSIFYGREKEVESLLQIIQKNKLITLTGPSGSGKTSLVNAGLIPRLKKGFLGQSGVEWAICSFRPGISPIDNMISAITSSGAINMDLRSNTEDFLNYKKIVDEDQSLSISKIYSESEINKKKNLLIVVDQLEDIFLFNNHEYSKKEEENKLLMGIISRTVRLKEISVYFLICLQTGYIPGLSKFSSIQELFSKSQYSLQNSSSEILKKLIKENFTKNGVEFDQNAYEIIVESLTKDVSLLPNIQYLLYRLLNENIESKKISENEINLLGGIRNVISNKLEEIFISLSPDDQESFSILYRSTMNFENPENHFFSSNFKNLLEISGIEKSCAERLISIFKNELGEFFCVFEEKISGIKSSIKQKILLNDIISFKYQKNINWDREKRWIDEEKTALLNYINFAGLADKFSSNEISLMSSPELESSIKWRDESIQNKNWSKKYSLNYSKTIDYINKSELTFKKNKEREELKIKRKKRSTKVVISTVSVLFIVALIAAISAIKSKEEAEINLEEARIATKLARKKTKEAQDAKTKADSSLLIAKKEQKIANDARLESRKSFLAAKAAQERALNSAILAQEESKNAREAEKKANREQIKALEERQKAYEAKDLADKLKEIALLETEFYPLMLELESITEDNINNTPKELVISKINQAVDKYYEYQSLLDATGSQKVETEGLFLLLQTALKVLENKNSYRETSMKIKNIKPASSIRSISSFESSIIALGGDDQYLYILNGASKAEIPRIKINERIRNVKIANSNIIFVGTFNGNVYRIDLDNQIERKKLIYKSTTSIKDLHYNKDLKQLFILSSKEVVMYQNENLIKLSEGYTFNSSAYIGKLNGLFLSTKEGLLIQTLENNFPININDIDFKSQEITAISLAGGRLFLGTNTGQIYVYKINYISNSNISISFENKINLHFSEITKLFYDDKNQKLYSASFDNQVLKFNTNYEDVATITSNAISFSGHEKWVWDINRIKDSQGNYVIITADENGNLLSWFDATEKLVAKVEELLSNKINEN